MQKTNEACVLDGISHHISYDVVWEWFVEGLISNEEWDRYSTARNEGVIACARHSFNGRSIPVSQTPLVDVLTSHIWKVHSENGYVCFVRDIDGTYESLEILTEDGFCEHGCACENCMALRQYRRTDVAKVPLLCDEYVTLPSYGGGR